MRFNLFGAHKSRGERKPNQKLTICFIDRSR